MPTARGIQCNLCWAAKLKSLSHWKWALIFFTWNWSQYKLVTFLGFSTTSVHMYGFFHSNSHMHLWRGKGNTTINFDIYVWSMYVIFRFCTLSWPLFNISFRNLDVEIWQSLCVKLFRSFNSGLHRPYGPSYFGGSLGDQRPLRLFHWLL